MTDRALKYHCAFFIMELICKRTCQVSVDAAGIVCKHVELQYNCVYSSCHASWVFCFEHLFSGMQETVSLALIGIVRAIIPIS